MKAVYAHLRTWTIRLKDERTFSYSTYNENDKYYHYGEVPKDHIEDFICQDTIFDDLMRTLCVYSSYKTLFKKKEYFDIAKFNTKIFKDEVLSFDIEHKYEIIDNPRIDRLERDLGFKGYSELVFDREQELRNMLLRN